MSLKLKAQRLWGDYQRMLFIETQSTLPGKKEKNQRFSQGYSVKD